MVQYYAFLLVLEGDFSFRRALQMRRCIAEPCCVYLKHLPNSGKYVSEKNYGHTMHKTKCKAGKQHLIPKRSFNYQNLMFQYYAFLLVLESDFSLRRALQMRKCIVEPCCGYLLISIYNIPQTQGNTLVIKIKD